MAIKFFGILIALFTIVFTILSLQDPYSLDLKSYSLDFKNIEATNLKAYESNSSIVRAYYRADSWERYQDRDVLKYFFTQNADFNLSANQLILSAQNFDWIKFEGNVDYTSFNGMHITSPEIFYFPKDKILESKENFKAYLNGNIIYGNSLNYDIRNKILKIQGVDAWLKIKQ